MLKEQGQSCPWVGSRGCVQVGVCQDGGRRKVGSFIRWSCPSLSGAEAWVGEDVTCVFTVSRTALFYYYFKRKQVKTFLFWSSFKLMEKSWKSRGRVHPGPSFPRVDILHRYSIIIKIGNWRGYICYLNDTPDSDFTSVSMRVLCSALGVNPESCIAFSWHVSLVFFNC